MQKSYLIIDWQNKPDNVGVCSTLCSGGVSKGSYAEFNLATHVGDDLSAVLCNRKKLSIDQQLPTEPVWLEQVHGNNVVDADELTTITSSENDALTLSGATSSTLPRADASVSKQKGTVCAVLTADCLPVFICNQSGTEAGVVHAGWKGIHAGVITATIQKLDSPINELLIYLGPAIGAQSFEVGEEVYEAFLRKNSLNVSAFKSIRKGHYLCDIYQLARIELNAMGIDEEKISGGQYCTYKDSHMFYSYRRQKQTGRMANLIWLT